MHTSYESYTKSLTAAELDREVVYAENLPKQNPMRLALVAEQSKRQARV
jgi:cell division inhibitor SulA